MPATTSGIYTVTNTVNGKSYVGSAVHFERRFKKHRTELRCGMHHSLKLQRAWRKHGEQSFVFRPILICAKKDLIFYEQRAIDAFRAVGSGYNVAPTAGSALGVKRSAETKVRMSVALTGRKMPPLTESHRAKLAAANLGNTYTFGLKHTDETKAKMSAARMGMQTALGYRHTNEAKAAISKAHKGNSYAVGKGHSEEWRALMSAKMTGRKMKPFTDEHRRNMSIAARNRSTTGTVNK